MSTIEAMRENNYCCHAEAIQIIKEGMKTRVAISITIDYSCRYVPYVQAVYQDILSRFTMTTEPRIERYYTLDMCKTSSNFMKPVKCEKKNLYAADIYLYLYDYKECGNLATFFTDLSTKYTYSGSVCLVIGSLNISFIDVKDTFTVNSSAYENINQDIDKNITLKNCEFASIVKDCDAFNKISFVNSKAILYTVKPLVPRVFIPDEGDPYLIYAITTELHTDEKVVKAFKEHFKKTIEEKEWLPCNGCVINLTRENILANSRTKFIIDRGSSVANIIFGHNLVEVFSDIKLVEAGLLKDEDTSRHNYNIPTGLVYSQKYNCNMFACSIPKGTYLMTGQGFGDFIQTPYKIADLKIYSRQTYIEHW